MGSSLVQGPSPTFPRGAALPCFLQPIPFQDEIFPFWGVPSSLDGLAGHLYDIFHLPDGDCLCRCISAYPFTKSTRKSSPKCPYLWVSVTAYAHLEAVHLLLLSLLYWSQSLNSLLIFPLCAKVGPAQHKTSLSEKKQDTGPGLVIVIRLRNEWSH